MEGFDEYERHFAGTSEQREPSPPPDFYSDDVDISFPDDYAAPDDANHDHYRSSEPPDTDMDFSSPPASPTQKPQHLHAAPQDASFVGMLLASPCPFCHAPYSLHVDDEMGHLGLVCAVCTNAFLLADANESWASMHAVFSSYVAPIHSAGGYCLISHHQITHSGRCDRTCPIRRRCPTLLRTPMRMGSIPLRVSSCCSLFLDAGRTFVHHVYSNNVALSSSLYTNSSLSPARRRLPGT